MPSGWNSFLLAKLQDGPDEQNMSAPPGKKKPWPYHKPSPSTSACGARLPQVLMSFRRSGVFRQRHREIVFLQTGGVDVREHTEHSGTLCTQYCQVCFHHTINYVTHQNCCFVFSKQGSLLRVATAFVPMSHVYVFPSIHFLPSIFFIFGVTGRGRGAPGCVTLQMSRLRMWEMCRRRLNSPDWLAGPTPPPSGPSRPVKTWSSQTLGRGLHGN